MAVYIVWPGGKRFSNGDDAIRYARKQAKDSGTSSVEISIGTSFDDPFSFYAWADGIVRNGRIYWNMYRGKVVRK